MSPSTAPGSLQDRKPRGGVGGEGSGDMESCVTCSRDGITIVWRAKPSPSTRPAKVEEGRGGKASTWAYLSRAFLKHVRGGLWQNKVRSWQKLCQLKVPSLPLPPGVAPPRQKLSRDTGVLTVAWSLDSRSVLAALKGNKPYHTSLLTPCTFHLPPVSDHVLWLWLWWQTIGYVW